MAAIHTELLYTVENTLQCACEAKADIKDLLCIFLTIFNILDTILDVLGLTAILEHNLAVLAQQLCLNCFSSIELLEPKIFTQNVVANYCHKIVQTDNFLHIVSKHCYCGLPSHHGCILYSTLQ